MEAEEQVEVKEGSMESNVPNEQTNDKKCNATFKRPMATIGPRRSPLAKLSKMRTLPEQPVQEEAKQESESMAKPAESMEEKSIDATAKDSGLNYIEPPWGGKPTKNYNMEVLKSGVIAETISLNERSFYVVGRLPVCDITLAHPTISRYHAILQYRALGDEENSQGLYVYDLGSTHGTYWNGNRIKPQVYARVRGGHMLRFGYSQRKYILQAPPDDQEDESEYSLTELKLKRELEKKLHEEQEGVQKDEKVNEGIDWGMGEDADEEADLQENPYATSLDEELVLEDPKKTLRGWFEREGYDLQYRTEEKGIGQFLCWVDLPLESVTGHPVRAEALVKGKKKESVVQCALEACKILDRYGLLRQANHEARKRKVRNWEEQDYYDSDEDNFLDRTGSVEKKREQRMRLAGKLEERVETYDSLLKKHDEVTKRINSLSNSLKESQKSSAQDKQSADEDALDAFMSTLTSKTLSKSDIAKMKIELHSLRKEEAKLVELLNLTRPANLPPLAVPKVSEDQNEHSFEQMKRSEESLSKNRGSFLHRALKKREKQSEMETRSAPVNIPQEHKNEPEEESDSDSEENSKINTNKILEENTSMEHEESSKEVAVGEPSDNKKTEEKQQKRDTKGSRKPRERLRKTADQDLYQENYSMWLPPEDQSGDGKTSLNEKYGY